MEPLLGLVADADEQVRSVEAPFVDYMWRITRHQHRQSAVAGARTFLTGHWGDQMLFSSAYLADLIGELRLLDAWRHLGEYGRFYGQGTVRALARIAAVDSARAFLPRAVLPMAKRLRRSFGQAPASAPWFSERLREFERSASTTSVKLPLDFHSVHARAIYIEARSKYHIHCMEWNNKAGALNGITSRLPLPRSRSRAVPDGRSRRRPKRRWRAAGHGTGWNARRPARRDSRARLESGSLGAHERRGAARGGRVHSVSSTATHWRHKWASSMAPASAPRSRKCCWTRAGRVVRTAGEWPISLAWSAGFGYSLLPELGLRLSSENRGNNPEGPARMTDPESKGARLPKRPYKTPRVVVHGKLQTLDPNQRRWTHDGAGKPGTRLMGQTLSALP